MTLPRALHVALDLAERPFLARAVRRQPLPPDVLTILKIAAGDEASRRVAAAATGKSAAAIREAAFLYVGHVLLADGADCYRVLGVAADAPQAELREHMRWLMKWLHPDRCTSAWEAAFAARVLSAWQEVKSPDRRARYDRLLSGKAERRHAWVPGIPRIAGPERSPRRTWTRGRAFAALAVVAVVSAMLLTPAQRPPDPAGGAATAGEAVE